MSSAVRSGGRAVLPGGLAVVWSVADGRRGRRWRESAGRDGTVSRSLLLEVSPAGRPTRLELTTAAGLLTLHPDTEGRELHGNVVTAAGIRHLRFDWSAAHELFVVASPAAAAVALRHLADSVTVGEGVAVGVIWIDDALVPRPGAWQVTRTAGDRWHLRDLEGTEERLAMVDPDGLPILPRAERWPLEQD